VRNIILILTLIFFATCRQVKNKTTTVLNLDTLTTLNAIDTSKYAILKFETTDQRNFTNAKSTDINFDEIIEIEKLLSKCIEKYILEKQKRYGKLCKENPDFKFDKSEFVIDLTKYKRQIIAVTNDKGEKEVWVNCFCINADYWKKEIVTVFDGGQCFFNLKINLTTKKYYDFNVNGVA
jgi:hypothetical protein